MAASSPIPDARALPLAGNIFALLRDMRGFVTERYRELGPVYRIRVMNRRFTVLAGPEANRFVQRDGARHLRSYEYWSRFNARFGAARSVLSTDGAEHKAFRDVFKRAYSRRFAQDHASELVDIARRSIARWPRGTPFSVTPALQRIVTDQVGTITTGVSPRPCNEELVHFVHVLLLTNIISIPFLDRSPRFRRAAARVDELYRTVVERHTGERRNRGASDPDLIDELLDLHESDPGLLSEADLKVSVLGPFIVALDTVAGTCSFMLYALLRDPDLLARARAEADALFASGEPAWSDVEKLDVLHRTALETLRMYPTVPMMVRTVANSFEFAGYRIEAGEAVMAATTVPHYLPEFFPEPDRFDIERYTAARAEHRRPYAYAPFGLGTHRCLGSGFAEVQILLTIATVLHEAGLALHPGGYRLKTTEVPLPRPRDSFRVRANPRAAYGN
ncbi:MAG: cytochrome P450 [Immundisolibacterales bacterium]|nr:cytochrome P450 [Immundisolibacterales bacterium]